MDIYVRHVLENELHQLMSKIYLKTLHFIKKKEEEVTLLIKMERKGDTETNGYRLKTCIRRLKIVAAVYELKLALSLR